MIANYQDTAYAEYIDLIYQLDSQWQVSQHADQALST